MNIPKYIVIHHSLTNDNEVLKNFDAIRKYHMSYAIDGYIVDADEFEYRYALGDGNYFKKPWRDIGYHYVLEYINKKAVITPGRDECESGAHAYQKMPDKNGKLVSINDQSIAICVAGNYDVEKLSLSKQTALVNKITDLIDKYKIKIQDVIGHRDIPGVFKSCPGKNIDLHIIRKLVIAESIDRRLNKGGNDNAI